MFDDNRSKRVVLTSHCLLNQNAISDGTADYSCCFLEVVEQIVGKGIGIIQMPCPELICLGLDRGDCNGSEREILVENSRIRDQLLTEENQKVLDKLVSSLIYQITEYKKNGFIIHGVIGVNRSPSCGVNTTSENNGEVEGYGVFIEKLLESLHQKRLMLPMVGVKTSTPEKAVEEVNRLLSRTDYEYHS
ncbi:DUF523 domain-containing protein [Vibrio rotiferianus]|uniref:DUF523 domain-containing protein n=1 Tax=Vibrio rotiferianus TaxID=190895 RepID=A0A7Y3ZEH2_9VIBR|nr:CD3072 family TudS-related putative desulfidase [Vibrio rotiferianus]NOH51150.1 DUF523 domain-containing protein [Vibrio rotiferianus]